MKNTTMLDNAQNNTSQRVAWANSFAHARPRMKKLVHLHQNCGSRRLNPAFTLIEVMLAIVIIGLGVLSLSALFAGAVSQQERSSAINLSVGVARNAEAILFRNIGRLDGPGLASLTVGEWRAAVVSPGSSRSTTLIVPQLNSGGPIYFNVKAPAIDLYTNLPQPGLPGPSINGSIAQGSYNEQNATLPFGGPDGVKPLPHSRVSTDLQIIIIISSTLGVADRSITMSLKTQPADPFAEPRGQQLFVDNPDPLQQTSTLNFDFGQNVGQVSRPARIISFNTPLTSQEWISRISVLPYTWRNDKLVSLNDRLVYVPDDTITGGRRPSLGYTLLYRRLKTTSQLMLLTYTLQPLTRPAAGADQPVFLPPDRQSDLDAKIGLLREITLELGHDPNTDQFYLEGAATDDDARIGLEPGQILLMKNSTDPITGELSGGSDLAVKVLTQRPSPDRPGSLRGVLDRSPRVNGRSPLRDFNSTKTITLWALNPAVKSRTSDQTEWRIKPIEARLFQLGGS